MAVSPVGCATYGRVKVTAASSGVEPKRDPAWERHAAYLERMLDTVQVQWERLLIESKIRGKPGKVVVKFILNARGEVARIVDHETTTSDQATQACLSAITDRSPYGAWTEDMIANLGREREISFAFYYQ